jgi:hypothetical protein
MQTPQIVTFSQYSRENSGNYILHNYCCSKNYTQILNHHYINAACLIQIRHIIPKLYLINNNSRYLGSGHSASSTTSSSLSAE